MSAITEPVAYAPTDRSSLLDPAPRRLLGRALLVGLVLELGLRGGPANAAVALAVALTIRILWTDDRLARREARIFVVLAGVPALFFAVRASPWLAWSNALASTALLVVAVLHARHGSVLHTTPAKLFCRALSGLERGVERLSIVRSVTPPMSSDQRDRVASVVRGVLVAVPLLFVLVALLASADAVFAGLVVPDVAVAPALGHVLLTTLFAGCVVVLAGAAAADEPAPGRREGFGPIELATILALIGAVLALFVVAQLVALTDAGERLIESAGLTPAEYARSGFFQLCWATGVLLAFLAVVRALAEPDALRHRVVVVLGAAVPALALGLVVVSLRRMALYDDAFGLTMLRLAAVGGAVWMGVVLVMTAIRNLGIGSSRDWLVSGAGLAAVALVIVANLADPEAFVARHNLERARDGAEVDVGYLATMSDDVVPVIAHAIDGETDPDRRALLRQALRCGRDPGGVATLNLAVSRANEHREEHCT